MMAGSNPYGAASVRKSLVRFLGGRAASALLTFTAFALAARVMPLAEYGHYVAALALMEMGMAFSGGGVDWVAGRLVPEYRLRAAGAVTVRLVGRLAILQLCLLAVSALAVVVGAPLLAGGMGLPGAAEPFRLAGGLIMLEGAGRLARDQMLGGLMRQGEAQAAQLLRTAILAGGLAYAWHTGQPMVAEAVLQIELVAAASGVLLGGGGLILALRSLMAKPAPVAGWQPTDPGQLRRMALQAYASQLLALSYGPQVITMLLARFLGAEAAALFGFARNFADQVRRYLPTDLFQGVVRPALMAYFSTSGDFNGLMLRLGLWLKASLIVLLPLLVFFTAAGKAGAEILGGGRYAEAGPVIFVLLLCAGAMAWRRVSEQACAALKLPQVCLQAGLTQVLMPLALVIGLVAGGGLMSAVLLVLAAEVGFCLRVRQLLARRGYSLGWSAAGYLRIFLTWLAVAACIASLEAFLGGYPAMQAVIAVVASFTGLYVLIPFDFVEKGVIAGWSPFMGRLIGWRAESR